MVKWCQKSQTHFEIRVSLTLQITFRPEWWICHIGPAVSVRSVFWILPHLPLFFICLREISRKVYCFELNARKTSYKANEPRGAYSKMALRCGYHCRIISRSLVFFPKQFLDFKMPLDSAAQNSNPFQWAQSLCKKLASRLPNWKHLDGILNLGHFFFSMCVSLEEKKINSIMQRGG